MDVRIVHVSRLYRVMRVNGKFSLFLVVRSLSLSVNCIFKLNLLDGFVVVTALVFESQLNTYRYKRSIKRQK